ncbi:MAG: tRNA (N6-threonylcarbamoyladenosine(37)-N6)-methyltransferase TrmO [Candidatus Burarchaeum sp.]|nr:tRNA (N6-threonylcarbamoyladenosine(37)-N6)-methyltransferase TrmO [Candidatus Burarchaeum sp.]MDO8339973.1 tRNA (N6-threonylcarbamoyladenosine(37)-N6)-methyltransferase TrmO [Candidatus Burarchaeum sp.]
MEISLRPIGHVKNRERKQHFGGWDKTVSDVVVNKRFEPALDGLEKYSHAMIVYWMHQVKGHVIKHHPQGTAPLVGIFACRCQARPNPIGISSVKIVRRRKNVLTVRGLDTVNGTPVLDIKPYTPQYDLVKNAKVPAWTKKLKY